MSSGDNSTSASPSAKETIVVPLRTPHDADRVYPTVEYLARQTDRPVEFITIIGPDLDPSREGARLQEVAARFQDQTALVASATVVVSDDLAADFLAQCVDRFVCMPTSATPFVGDHFVGSYASALLARTTEPVVLVGPCVSGQDAVDVDRLVIALSGDEECLALLPAARSVAEQLQLPVETVHVVEPDDDQVFVDAEGEVRLWFPDVVFSTIGIEPIEAADVGTGLVEHARGALLAVATHARSGLSRIAEGSRTFDAVVVSTQPVLVVGPHINITR